MAHAKLKGGDGDLRAPRISMEYFYNSKQDEDAKVNPMLVAINEQSNEKYARAIGEKGLGDK